MADTTVETNVLDTQDAFGVWGPYWSDKDTGLKVFVDSEGDISFARTTNAGAGWTTTEIEAGTVRALACWYDKETPGDTGTLVHVAWMDDADNDVNYRTIDVSDASLGTARVVDAGVSVDATPSNNRITITKTVGGNLLVAFSTQTEIECYRSIDSGANWTDRADCYEIATEGDWVQLFPANVDPGDAVCLFLDRSANDFSLKMYDDSANTWTEKDIDTAITDSGVFRQSNYAAAVRHSDSHLLTAVHSQPGNAANDFRTFDLTVNSIAAPTVTAKTNIFTDQAASGYVGVIINQQNDDWYVAYEKGGAFNDLTDVVFHKSADGGDAWGTEQPYSETNDDNRNIGGGRTVGNNGGRIQWGFYNDDLADLFVNLVNDIEIAASGGIIPQAVQHRKQQGFI